MALVAERLMTAAEFALLPDPPQGGKMELVRGRVVVMAPVGPDHGERALDIGALIRGKTKVSRAGKVRVETGYWIPDEADHVRAPDVSFVRTSRLGNETVLHGAVTQVPDLAVEVTSPSDRDRDLQEKVDDYLRGGVLRVWVVRPELRTVTVHRPGGDAHTFTMGDTLTADDAAIPDDAFTLPVADIFA